jgi:hypothetical protein
MWDTTTDNVPSRPVGLTSSAETVGLGMVWSGAARTVLPTAAARPHRGG